MATLVQTYPHSGQITMLQSRSGTNRNMVSNSNMAHNGGYANPQQPRSTYTTAQGSYNAPMTYRGTTMPAQQYPYANNTQPMSPAAQWQAFRAASASAVPTLHNNFQQTPGSLTRSPHPATASLTNLPTTFPAMGAPGSSVDDSVIVDPRRRVAPGPRPQSAHLTGNTSTPLMQSPAPVKNVPDRYRRPAQRQSDVGSSTQISPIASQATTANIQNNQHQHSLSVEAMSMNSAARAYNSTIRSVDDMQLYLRDDAETQRIRRRSMPTLNAASLNAATSTGTAFTMVPGGEVQTARAIKLINPSSPTVHSRNASTESVNSHRSTKARPLAAADSASPTANPAPGSSTPDHTLSRQQHDIAPRLVQIPARTTSADVATHNNQSSPLSRPVTMAASDNDGTQATQADAEMNSAMAAAPPVAAAAPSPTRTMESPAMKQLAAVSQKGGKFRSKSSRLRRVLSMGNMNDAPQTGEETVAGKSQPSLASSSRLQKNPTANELEDAEQARVIAQQEAAGIGHSIYAGSRLFSSSTDNLSISSTASSASIMIRKMGRGMKKGGRSLAGLFRPKSVIGVPAMDAVEGSQATVSMVNVEAERERVNVNLHPDVHTGGGTDFPHLERNSIDAASAANLGPQIATSSPSKDVESRKTIVGGDNDRAEILAAVRKGILKRSATSGTPPAPAPVQVQARPSSPAKVVPPSTEVKNTSFVLPEIPNMSDSPLSTNPSTPNDEAQGHKRTESVTIGNEDYFMTALRMRQDTKSAPVTPRGSTTKRNATFSPRLIFHDTWPPQEYDRRGEISTCNRLTPMLAQQIKEELNSFKMEMEVHETSKIYTHFF